MLDSEFDHRQAITSEMPEQARTVLSKLRRQCNGFSQYRTRTCRPVIAKPPMREFRQNLAALIHEHADANALSRNKFLNNRWWHAGIDIPHQLSKLSIGIGVCNGATVDEMLTVPKSSRSRFHDNGILKPLSGREGFTIARGNVTRRYANSDTLGGRNRFCLIDRFLQCGEGQARDGDSVLFEPSSLACQQERAGLFRRNHNFDFIRTTHSENPIAQILIPFALVGQMLARVTRPGCEGSA